MSDTSNQRLPLSAIVFRTVVCLAFVGAGLGIVGALVATKPDAGRNATKAPPPRVAVLELAPIEIERFVRGYGTARAVESADVPARVGAVVVRLGANYAVGRPVAKDEILVELDASDFRQQVEIAREAIRAIEAQVAVIETQARAARETAELVGREREIAARDLERVENAAREGAAQAREVDLARAALIAASRAAVAAEDAVASIAPRLQALAAQKAVEESRLKLAESSADRCLIRAPIAGTLQLAELEVGESVSPGQTIARVVDRTRIEVPLRIPASARSLAPVGARAEVVVRADGRRFDGEIVRVAPEDDPATRTATVFVEFTQGATREGASEPAPTLLAPGAFVEARISAGRPELRTLVPRRAIRDDFILVVESGRVHQHRVSVDYAHSDPVPSTGIADTDWAVLTAPLGPGTLVVLDGSRSLAEGQEISPVKPGEAAAAGGTPASVPAAEAPRAGDGA
jgi:RND family efflux transporter MFP subunit